MSFKTITTTLVVACVAVAVSVVTIGDAAAASSPVRIVKVQYDSPGTDNRSSASLNAEYVTIKNTSTKNQVLTGWTLRDKQNHVYTFPTYTLGAGKSVTVRTGKGTATSTNRYYNSGNYVWNNTGDSAILRTKAGSQVSVCTWTKTSPGYKNC